MSKAPTDYDELVADNRRLRLDKRDLIASRERCRKALAWFIQSYGQAPRLIPGQNDGHVASYQAAVEALARIDEKVEPK